jgi:3-oxoacyl-[acyl-carrier-protein] synthase II
MSRRRVVVTGMGVVCPIGNTLTDTLEALRNGRNGIKVMDEWESIGNLRTRLAGPVVGVERKDFKRKETRTMGRVAILAAHATDQAIQASGLTAEQLGSGRTGLAYGSSHGSSQELETHGKSMFQKRSLDGLPGSAYLRIMSHTCAVNLAIRYGIKGRILTTCSACTSSSQAIGYGFESIKDGYQDVMICGGAEELHFSHAGVFDILLATSTRFNQQPDQSPRPFDQARDGLVVAEGAATLVLESLEHAQERGAQILAEVLGFGTTCDGAHVTHPQVDGISEAMRLALADADLPPSAIQYVNAHATGTPLGDIAESQAIMNVLGLDVPVSSTKGLTGHSLGACGGMEAIFCIQMMQAGFLAANRNLQNVDEQCAPLDYVRDSIRPLSPRYVMNNTFAFGGINTAMLLGQPPTSSTN